MRKYIKTLILFSLILVGLSLNLTSYADELEPYNLSIDGKVVNFTDELGHPYLTKTSRTMIPVRIISENMGYDVKWDGGNQKVFVSNEKTKIELQIGKNTAIVNGKMVPIDVQDGKPVDTKAMLVPAKGSHRTYVPLRFVSEAMGADVKYERKNGVNCIEINTGKKPEKPTNATTVTTKQAELTKVGEGYNQHIVDLAKKYNYSTMNLGEGHYFDYKKNQKNGFIEPVIQLDAESNNGLWFTFSVMNEEEYKGKNYEIKFECVSNPEYTKGTKWKSMNGYFPTAGLPMKYGAKRGDVVKYEISIRNGNTTKVYPFTIKLGGMHEVE
ncbi:copper amine oxidase N-terminal domain-containing protein [Anaerosalibacter sp. Marseille-P3206]|uniref:copper amine oxidase N-terminal domain-containing protein n=1 Tax=Anaerosalibacter sp. Marseille-P3206 TaxID=1871005 RepID=UPI0009874A3C|nr:copper amine oxidase N-terminal domain-containing protein [Anaerosalibacter sp. Marseille-P3206]